MADLLFRAPIQYEPYSNNRFLVRFPTDIGIQSWAVKSIGAPKLTPSTKEMKFINTSTYVNTSYKWEPVNLVLRDFIAPSQAQALMEYVRLGIESATGRMGYTIGHAKNIEFERLDPTGVVTQKWIYVNSIVTGTIDFGEADYDNDDVTTISFTLQPQRCILLF